VLSVGGGLNLVQVIGSFVKWASSQNCFSITLKPLTNTASVTGGSIIALMPDSH